MRGGPRSHTGESISRTLEHRTWQCFSKSGWWPTFPQNLWGVLGQSEIPGPHHRPNKSASWRHSPGICILKKTPPPHHLPPQMTGMLYNFTDVLSSRESGIRVTWGRAAKDAQLAQEQGEKTGGSSNSNGGDKRRKSHRSRKAMRRVTVNFLDLSRTSLEKLQSPFPYRHASAAIKGMVL